MWWSSKQYNAVPSDDRDKDEYISERPPKKTSTVVSDLLLGFCTLILVVCTFLNFSALSSRPIPANQRKSTWFLSTQDANIQRPDQFVGLERLYPNTTASEIFDGHKITTYPTLMQQVDSGRKSFVYPSDPRAGWTRIGTISPEDRNLLVTSTVSTIVQFRMRDYRFESCRLKISLPPSMRHNISSETNTQLRKRDWILGSSTNMMTVYKLNLPSYTWLDSTHLSYYSIGPKRGDSIAWFDISGEGEWLSDSFYCEQASILSFEIAGGSKDCLLDVWQDREAPIIGLTIEQESTL